MAWLVELVAVTCEVVGEEGDRGQLEDLEGWNRMIPNRTQELASLIVAPTPGTNGSIIVPAARIAPTTTSAASVGTDSTTPHPCRPDRDTPTPVWRVKIVYGDSSPPTWLAEVAESTITRPSITKAATITTIV